MQYINIFFLLINILALLCLSLIAYKCTKEVAKAREQMKQDRKNIEKLQNVLKDEKRRNV
jgi:hypothetical protein